MEQLYIKIYYMCDFANLTLFVICPIGSRVQLDEVYFGIEAPLLQMFSF